MAASVVAGHYGSGARWLDCVISCFYLSLGTTIFDGPGKKLKRII